MPILGDYKQDSISQIDTICGGQIDDAIAMASGLCKVDNGSLV